MHMPGGLEDVWTWLKSGIYVDRLEVWKKSGPGWRSGRYVDTTGGIEDMLTRLEVWKIFGHNWRSGKYADPAEGLEDAWTPLEV